MTKSRLIKPAVSAAAAGLGAAAGGPIGGILGVWLGSAMGHAAAGVIGSYTEEFGKDAGKKLIEAGGETLIDKLKEESPDLERAYRETLRVSLELVRVRSGMGYEDWFANWNLALSTPGQLDLQPLLQTDLEPDKIDAFIRRTFESLDAQGNQLREKSTSFKQTRRPLPEPLFSILEDQLPELLQENFLILVTSPEYESAWREAQNIFTDFARSSLYRIEESTHRIEKKTSVLPQVVEDLAAARQMIDKLHRLVETSLDTRKTPEAPSTAWPDYFETLLSQGSVIYEDPWESWHTEEERDFKKLLNGRCEEHFPLWQSNSWQQIIDLWEPLASNEYFNVAHPHWQDKPLFRSLIHEANSVLFVSHAQLTARGDFKEHYREAMHFLIEVLKEPPYAMLGASSDRLTTDDARLKNENFIGTLLFAQEFLRGWGAGSLAMIGMTEATGDALKKRITIRLNELRWVLERHPEQTALH